jgi:tRNA-binding EMAP/Myf-like protein
MYRLFYDYAVSGDVLFILLDPEKKVETAVTKENVTALYAGEELVGINIFAISQTVKLTAKGMIVAPHRLLVAALDVLLATAGLPPLPLEEASGYQVAKIVALEEHPLDEKAHLVTLQSGKETFSTVSWYPNLAVGASVVVATEGTIGYDGSVFHKSISRNLPIDCAICSAMGLRIESAAEGAFLAEGYRDGEDFFLGGE